MPFDKNGKIIDNFRINKYENLCHFMVRKYFPALSLYEASMNYDDLINQCRYETLKALMNFDKEIAMKSFRTKKELDSNGNPIIIKIKKNGVKEFKMIPDYELRQKEEERKSKNPDLAIIKAEESIVYGRLNNYMRRTRWKYSQEIHGGTTIRMGLKLNTVLSPNDDIDTLIDELISYKNQGNTNSSLTEEF